MPFLLQICLFNGSMKMIMGPRAARQLFYAMGGAMNPFVAILLSFIPVFAVLGIAAICKRWGMEEESSRKLVHILLSNWILLALVLFDRTWAACVAPACFIVLNLLSHYRGLFSGMERQENDSLGTVWYAVSLLILCFFGWRMGVPWIAACGMLAMGYGDGLAALVGLAWGRHPFPKPCENKTLEGAAAVFFFTALPVEVLCSIYAPEIALTAALCCGVIGLALELFSPRGVDNLTLPLGIALVVYLLLAAPWAAAPLIGLSLSLAVLLPAYYMGGLTGSALWIAALLGSLLYTWGGALAFEALVLFFVLGSLATKLGGRKKHSAYALHKHRGPRTVVQVAANGLPALIFALLYRFSDAGIWLVAVLVSFAAATADTFSSEIGMLSPKKPVSLLGLRPVERGISGGVTLLGLGGAAIGSCLVALLAIGSFGWKGWLTVFLFGMVGSLLDSLLGTLLQAKYHLPSGGLTERPLLEGVPLRLASGIAWVTNDVVNFASAFFCGVLCISMVL